MTSVMGRIEDTRTAAFSLSRLLFLVVGVIGLILAVVLMALSVNRPYMGADVEKQGASFSVVAVSEYGVARLSGIRAGDVVVSLNGYSLDAGTTKKELIGGAAVKSVEVIDQQGIRRTVSLDGQQVPAGQVLELVRYFLLGIAFWLIATYVFLKRPSSESALILYLLGSVTVVGLVSVAARDRGIPFAQELLFASLLFIGPLFARLFVVFPEGNGRRRWRARLVYLPSFVGIVILLAVERDYSSVQTVFRILVLPIFSVGLIVGLIALVRKSVKAGYVRVRQQARIVMLGAFVGVTPFLALSVFPYIVAQKLIAPPGITILALVALPGSIAYSLVRHRLFDIDLVLKRSMVYGVLSLTLAACYIAVAFLLYSALSDSRQELRFVAVGAAGVTSLMTYGPLWVRLRSGVDRRLYKDRRDYRQALRSLNSSLATMTDQEEIAHFITASASDLLGLYGACLLLSNKQGFLQARAAVGMYVDSPTHAALISHASSLKESHAFPNLAPQSSGLAFFIPLQVGGRQIGVLCLGNKASREGFTVDDLSFLYTFASQAGAALENARLFVEAKEHRVELDKAYIQLQQTAEALVENKKILEEAYLGMARTLVLTLESRDLYTRGHSERVSRLVLRIAPGLGVTGVKLQKLELAARLHDIGKTGVADAVLLKPGPFDLTERAEMERHPTKGVEILRFLDFLKDVLPVIESHHEWWDGSGYPWGLKGEEIPLGGRVLAVADAYDAMVSKRPHRAALPHEEALRRLKEGSGVQWDPTIVEAFIQSEGLGRLR